MRPCEIALCYLVGRSRRGGLLSILTFGVAALIVYLYSLRMALSGDTDVFVLHLMLTAFGITLLVSHILQYFPLNYLFFMMGC